jgi:hypothetical protein
LEKIRVGFLLDSLNQSNWIITVINDIISHEKCDICFIGINKLVVKDKVQKRKNTRLFQIISFIEKKLLIRQLDQFYTQKIPLKESFQVCDLYGEVKNNISVLDEASLEIVKQKELDVIIRFGFGILRGEILRCATFGIWSFHHGDNQFYRGRPACFWEIVKKENKVGAILQVLNSELDNGVVINSCYTKVVKSSLWLTMNQLFKQSSELAVNSINLIIENDKKIYWHQKPKQIYYTNELFRYPNTYFTLLYSSRLVYEFCFGRFGKIGNNWKVKIKKHNSGSKGFFGFSFYGFKIVNYLSKGFIADPFIREGNGEIELFVEEYDKEEKKGSILKIVLNKKFEITQTQTVLKLNYHISYPFIFKLNGNWFMIPETSDSRKVSLYKEDYNGDFILIRDLLVNDHYYDPTIVHYEGKYWLFVTRKSKGGLHDCELCCFYSNDLVKEELTPHPLNPVKMDITSSRPAGSIFIEDGVLYRPSQNGSISYGGSISINKITKLNEKEFSEEVITQILPKWQPKLKGVHTLNFSENYIVIDVNYG